MSPLLAMGARLKRTATMDRSQASSGFLDGWPSASHHHVVGSIGSKSQLGEPLLFNGLRVRMGVVTGEVPSGTAIKNSALFQLAKVIGDFGNGGQVIIDDATFGIIKEDVQLLGAMEAGGLNHRRMSSGRSCWSSLLRLLGCARNHVPAEEAVILDMGAFCRPLGDDSGELPYTTSRALDVKQPPAGGGSGGAAAGWWGVASLRRLADCLCCACCRSSSGGAGDGDDASMSGGSSPRGQRPLPPVAAASRPFLGGAAGPAPSSTGAAAGSRAALHSLSGASSGGVPSQLAAAGSGCPSSASGSRRLGSFRLESAASGDARDGVSGRSEAQVVGRLTSFSARATRQWADLRKTLARSTSSQQPAARRDWESVRLFQILAPALAARAHVWYNQLNVKEGWVCWDTQYFSAPGSTMAPLTGGSLEVFGSGHSCSHHTANSPPSLGQGGGAGAAAAATGVDGDSPRAAGARAALDAGAGDSGDSTGPLSPMGALLSSASLQHPLLQPLPPVTMVFMAVEGPAELVQRRRPFTPQVQALVGRVVRDALRRLGGYLCRVQDGDMKVMVAFASPITALEWCLTVQVAAMYLPWPRSAIMLLPSCREQVDSSGRTVFRGPRLKMGVCEGVPKSILPDHEGRADYHGQSINMAARFMDKGAQGGQIACTRELAEKALAVWAAAAAAGGSGGIGAAGSCGSSGAGMQLRSYSSTSGRAPPGLRLAHSIAEDEVGAGDAHKGLWQVGDMPLGDSTAADAAAQSDNGAALLMRPARSSDPGVAAASGTQHMPPAQRASSSSGGGRLAWALGHSGSGSKGSSRPWRLGRAHVGAPPLPPTPGAGSPSAFGGLAPATSGDLADAAAAAGTAGSQGQAQQGRSWSDMQQLNGSGRTGACGAAACAPVSSSSGGCLAASRGMGGSSWPGLADAAAAGGGSRQQQQASSPFQRLPQQARSGGSATSLPGRPGASSQQRQYGGPHSHSHSPPPPLPPLPPVVAPSPFVMDQVARAPMQVEAVRLGLFSFKGGPPQQEMVQVVPSSLLGRQEFVGLSGAPHASRKGQMLLRLEGRVGEPVPVNLPALAQEYHARLPDRLSGLTCLPHVTLPAHAPHGTAATTTTAAAAAAAAAAAGGGAAGGSYVLQARSSRSVSLPVRSHPTWTAAAPGEPGGALPGPGLPMPHKGGVRWAAAGAQAGGAARLELVSSSSAAAALPSATVLGAAGASGAGAADAGAPDAAQGAPLTGSACSAAGEGPHMGAVAADAAGNGSPDHVTIAVGQACADAAPPGIARLACGAAAAAATVGAAGSSSAVGAGAAQGAGGGVGPPGLLQRHDSFRSVEEADEECGLSPPAAGARRKSDASLPRTPCTSPPPAVEQL